MDATMKSNVAVGPPIDILCYKTDSLQVKMRTRLEQNDPYLVEISRKWQDGIERLVRQMPVADFSKTALGFASAAYKVASPGRFVVRETAFCGSERIPSEPCER